MKCLRLLTLLPLCALLSACLTGQQDPPFTLTLAHMNDTHSQFDPVNAELKGALFGKQGKQIPSTPASAVIPACSP